MKGNDVITSGIIIIFNAVGVSGSIVVCVSPLASLMMDQKSKFTLQGVMTDFVGESQSDTEAIERVVNGHIQLVLITPESIISNPRYRSMLLSKTYQHKLVALVVDEAHCVKTW